MSLILAVEPDRSQARQLTAVVRGRLRAELVLADTAETALAELGDRVPDLILTSALLSTKDETALAEWLRKVDGAAAHVQTLTIPVLETPVPRVPTGRTGIFSLAMLGERPSSPAAPDGCDPAVFAEQCAAYLEHATNERGVVEEEPPPPWSEAAAPPPLEPAPPPAEALPPPAQHAIAHRPRDGDPVFVSVVPSPTPIAELPVTPAPPPERVDDGVEIDLSAMLDDSVFQQLSEAIETVSRDSARNANTPANGNEAWTPSSLGSAAVWPGMDLGSIASQTHAAASATPSASARSAAKQFPARKPIQDEWGFFDPAQCGFSALLAKLDEITHVASPLPAADPSMESVSPDAE